jgi:hypothetical protein
MKNQTIVNKLKDKFFFLQQEYGFKGVSSVIDKDFCIIKMQNDTTGIALHYERREDDVFVYLYRLIDGKMVEDKIPISSDFPLNSIELRFIIQFREGEKFINKFQNQSSKSFDELLQDIAADLRKYANDVLKGNFEVFREVDSIAKKRRLDWQNSQWGDEQG